MTSCHNCGIPIWATSHAGVETKLRLRAHNRFARDSKRTVWCCSESCALQARAQAEMGTDTHRWPMTLAEYAAHERATSQRRSNRAEIPSQVADSTESKIGKNEKVDLPHMDTKNAGVSARKGGRPRKWKNDGERMRAYRATRNGAGVAQ